VVRAPHHLADAGAPDDAGRCDVQPLPFPHRHGVDERVPKQLVRQPDSAVDNRGARRWIADGLGHVVLRTFDDSGDLSRRRALTKQGSRAEDLTARLREAGDPVCQGSSEIRATRPSGRRPAEVHRVPARQGEKLGDLGGGSLWTTR
jgi:hypothetical protein